MTRLVTTGLDQGLFPTGANAIEGEGFLPAGVPTSEATITRLGQGRSAKAPSGDSTARYSGNSFTGATGRTYYSRVYFRTSGNPAVATQILNVYTSAFAFLCSVRLNTSGILEFLNSAGTVVGTGSTVLTSGSFWRVELAVNVAASGSSSYTVRLAAGNAEADDKLTSATEITGTATLTNSAPGYIGQGKLSAVANTIDLYWDDVVINDDQGSVHNSWVGGSKVTWLKPTADIAAGVFQKPGGATTNLYTSVDNIPPVGIADSSNVADAEKQIRGGFAAGNYDLTLQTYLAAGVPDGAIIKRVQAVASCGTYAGAPVIIGQVKLLSNPVDGSSDPNLTAPILTGTHASASGGAYLVTRGTAVDNPTVLYGTAPTMRFRKSDASAKTLISDIIGAYVEWTPRPPEGVAAGSSSARGTLYASRIEVASIEGQGHSYAHGDGATTPSTQGMMPRIAAALFGPPTVNNHAIGSSQVSFNGSYTPPGGTLGQDSVFDYQENYAADDSAPYASRTGHYVWMTGVNDLKYDSAGVPNSTTIEDFKTALTYIRAAAVFDERHASVSFGAGWSDVSNTQVKADTLKGTNSAAAIGPTWTVPSDFPGGHLFIVFVSTDSTTATRNGLQGDIYLDGVLLDTFDSRAAASATGGGLTRRITKRLHNVPASAAGKALTLDVTASSGAGGYIDAFGLELDNAPMQTLVAQPQLTATGRTNLSGSFTNTTIDDWNTKLAALAASFPGDSVAYADGHLATMNSNLTYFAADQSHPNTAGHQLIADAVVASMQAQYDIHVDCVGTSAGGSSATATLTVRVELSGTAAGGSSADAALTVRANLAGSAAGGSSTAGQLNSAFAGSSAGSSSATADPQVTKPLAGASAGSSTADGIMRSAFAGSSAGGSSASAAETVTKPLSGSSTGASTAVGVLGVEGVFEGFSNGSSTASGELTVTKPLEGSAAGSSSAAASPTVVRPLEGLAAGSSSTGDADAVVTKPLVGASAGGSSVAGQTTVLNPLSGTAAGGSSVEGDLSRVISVSANSAAGEGNATGRLRSAFAGSAAGGSTCQGSLTKLPSRVTIKGVAAKPDIDIEVYNGTV